MTTRTHFSRLRFKMDWLWPILFIPFISFLHNRHISRLRDEGILLKEPIVIAMLGLLLLVIVIGLFSPGWTRRHLTRLLPIAFLAGIVVNIVVFTESDASTRISSFHVRPDTKLSSLGQMPGWRNHWSAYSLYTSLHDIMRGSTIIAYVPPASLHPDFVELLHPVYRTYMSELAEYREEAYDAEITQAQATWLMSQPHVAIEDFSTKLLWVIVQTPGPLADTYRVLKDDTHHYLVRESMLQAVRAQ